MTIQKKGAVIAAGLAIVASLFVYARKADATMCQRESSSWTESVTCPGTSQSTIYGRAWGTTTMRIGGIPFRIRSLYAQYFGSRVGFAVAQGINSSGGAIANCYIYDYSPTDLYPEGTSHSACATGARFIMTVSY